MNEGKSKDKSIIGISECGDPGARRAFGGWKRDRGVKLGSSCLAFWLRSGGRENATLAPKVGGKGRCRQTKGKGKGATLRFGTSLFLPT